VGSALLDWRWGAAAAALAASRPRRAAHQDILGRGPSSDARTRIHTPPSHPPKRRRAFWNSGRSLLKGSVSRRWRSSSLSMGRSSVAASRSGNTALMVDRIWGELGGGTKSGVFPALPSPRHAGPHAHGDGDA
jgi:hypothetical protein